METDVTRRDRIERFLKALITDEGLYVNSEK